MKYKRLSLGQVLQYIASVADYFVLAGLAYFLLEMIAQIVNPSLGKVATWLVVSMLAVLGVLLRELFGELKQK